MAENIEATMRRMSEALRLLGKYRESNICALFADLAHETDMDDLDDIRRFTESLHKKRDKE